MSSVHPTTTFPETFTSIHAHLTSTYPPPLLPPPRPHDPSLSDKITSLQIHPTLEALLHILNADLPSAHFLVRKMQSAPAVEGMYIHGLLHRVEGDYDNCRAWYADVHHEDVFVNLWGKSTHDEERDADAIKDRYRVGKVPAQKRARDFLDAIENLNKNGNGDRQALSDKSSWEIDALLDWCKAKFGTDKVMDARSVWVGNSEEIKKIGQDMTTGDKGHRMF